MGGEGAQPPHPRFRRGVGPQPPSGKIIIPPCQRQVTHVGVGFSPRWVTTTPSPPSQAESVGAGQGLAWPAASLV